MNVSFSFKDDYSASLKKLAKDINDKILRSSARAGALVFYDLIHQNAPTPKTGNLQKSIYHKFVSEEDRPNYKAYRVGINHIKAPHWYWLEYGHISYYAVKKDPKTGEFVTLVRPDKMGTPPPKRRASRAEKDAYYIPRKNGPFTVLGTAFVRKSYDQGLPMVRDAVIKRAQERFSELMNNPAMVIKDVD
jgi:hypothetical protein